MSISQMYVVARIRTIRDTIGDYFQRSVVRIECGLLNLLTLTTLWHTEHVLQI